MDMYAFRTLRGQPLRLALTVGGVASCIVLMFFLLAVYRGAADGSVEYVRRNKADLWVLQKNATNILRGSSLVMAAQAEGIGRLPGVRSVASVLLLLSTLRKGGKTRVLFHDLDIGPLARRLPPTMSQGEKQRVAIARALANDPALVLADEPTGSLETRQGFDIIRLLHGQAKARNAALIVASHDLRLKEFADRTLRLQDGALT